MKKSLLILLVVLLCCCSGCGIEHKDINELSIVLGAVFDYLPEQQVYEVYTQVAKPVAFTKGEGGGGKGEGFILYRGRGKSVFEAVRAVNRKANYRLFWSHCDVYIIDKKMAQKGIFPFLDFMIRDNEIRETANLFITEIPAHDLLQLQDGSEKVPLMGLKKIARLGEQTTGSSFNMEMMDVMRNIVMRNSFAIAPLVRAAEPDVQGVKEQRKFLLSGIAVFNKDKLAGLLTPEETRGYMFASNKIENTVVVVPVRGKQVTLEVVKDKGKITPQIQEGNLSVVVEIAVSFNYGEIDAPLDLTDPSLTPEVQRALNRELEKEVAAAIHKSQALQVDYFNFAREIQLAYPQMWKTMQKDWSKEIFPDSQVEVKINSKLLRSGLLIYTDIGG